MTKYRNWYRYGNGNVKKINQYWYGYGLFSKNKNGNGTGTG